MSQVKAELEDKLKLFPYIHQKAVIAEQVLALTQISGYELFPVLLEGVASINTNLLNDENITFIIKYLRSLDQKNYDVMVAMCDPDCLQSINNQLNQITLLYDQDAMFSAFLDAIRFGVSALMLGSNKLPLFHPSLLRSQALIRFLNQHCTHLNLIDSFVLVLNDLVSSSPDSPVEAIIHEFTADKILEYKNILERLNALGISYDKQKVLAWEGINHLHNSWNQKNVYLLKNTLNGKLFTCYGVAHILKYLEPKKLTPKIINQINELINKSITDSDDEIQWRGLESCFFEGLNWKQTSERIAIFLNAIRDRQFDPNKLCKLLKELLPLEKNFFTDTELLHDIALLIRMDEKLYGWYGLAFYHKIKDLGATFAKIYAGAGKSDLGLGWTETYIDALNKIVNKMEYVHVLDCLIDKELSTEALQQTDDKEGAKLTLLAHLWFTQQGLEKLNLFNKRFFSEQGFRYISKLPLHKLKKTVIESMNKADFDSITRHFIQKEVVSIDSEQSKIVKLEKINEYLNEQLDDQIDADSARKNAETLLTAECPFMFQYFISAAAAAANDPPLLSIDKGRAPLTFAELNQNFCIIKNGEVDILCSKASIQKLYDTQRPDPKNKDEFIHGKHPYLDRPIDLENDLIPLKLDNVDLDYINASLGLVPATENNRSADKLKNKLFLENLKQSPLLMVIPETLFLKKELLITIDRRYLTEPVMCQYLNRFANDGLAMEDVVALNEVADQLLAKLTKVAAVLDSLSKLPSELFKKDQFPPSIFIKIPDNWLQDNFLVKVLSTFSEYITSQFIIAGREIMFSFDKIDSFITFFTIYKDESPERLEKLIDKKQMLTVMANYISDQRFLTEILPLAAPHLTLGICKEFVTDNVQHIKLFRKIYQTASLNTQISQLIAPAVFQHLRGLTKNSLDSQEVNESLSQLKLACQTTVDSMKENLERYLPKFNMDALGKPTVAWSSMKKEQLAAFNALCSACQEENGIPFLKLNEVIQSQQRNIDSEKKGPQSLRAYTDMFTETAEIIMQTCFRDLFKACEQNEKLLRSCLLDDLFYGLLSPPLLLRLAKSSPIFFEIIDMYRPAEFQSLFGQKNESSRNDIEQLQRLYRQSKEQSRSKEPIPDPSHISSNGNGLSRAVTIMSDKHPPIMNGKRPILAGSKDWKEPHSKASGSKQTLRRIPGPNGYQLQDVDLRVGILQLQDKVNPQLHTTVEQLPKEKNKGKAKTQEILFLTPGRLDQTGTQNVNMLDYIKQETTQNPGKICYGIMNIHGIHWVSIFAYTSPSGSTQVFFLDPAFHNESKRKSMELIKALFEDTFSQGAVMDSPIISQQFNGHECGICCLQNGEDLIDKNLITIENEKLVFHRDKLTLDANEYSGTEQAFLKVYNAVNAQWEKRLATQTQDFLCVDGELVPAGDYDFQTNKKVQQSTMHIENMLSGFLILFLQENEQTIDQMLLETTEIPNLNGKFGKIINAFIERDECKQLLSLIEETAKLNATFQSEKSYKIDCIAKTLLERIQIKYLRDVKCEQFNRDFCTRIVADKPLLAMPEDVKKLYLEYSKQPGNEWIEFYRSMDQKFDHYAIVYKFIHTQIEKNEQLNSSLQREPVAGNGIHGNLRSFNQPLAPGSKPVSLHSPGVRVFGRKPELSQFSTNATVLPREDNQLLLSLQSALSRSGATGLAERNKDHRLPNNGRPNPILTTSKTGGIPANPIAANGRPNEEGLASIKSLATRELTALRAELEQFIEHSKPKQSNFFSWLGGQKAESQLSESCTRWIAWFAAAQDIVQIKRQLYYVSSHLYDTLNGCKDWRSNFEWGENTLGGVIKLPLAKLLGADTRYDDYNTPKLIEKKIKPIGSVEPLKPVMKSGYEYLSNEIGLKLMSLRREVGGTEELKDLSNESMSNRSNRK